MRELVLNSGAFAAPTFCQINHPVPNPPYIKQRTQEESVKYTEICTVQDTEIFFSSTGY